MAQKKTNEVEAWLRRPDPGTTIILLYGPDRGLVSERAGAFVAGTGLNVDDPFSVVRLAADEIEGAPGKLREEAATVPMFADRRLIWVKGAGTQKSFAEEVRALTSASPRETLILIEAADMKKSAPLRAVVESAPNAMALPCYPDENRSVDAVIDEALAREGIGLTMEARQLLRANLGADRLATRSEVEKLVLFCYGKAEIGIDDVRAMIGDVSGISMDDAVDSVIVGDATRFDSSFARLVTSGTNPFLVLSAAMRQIQALQLMRFEMDQSGKSASAVVAAAKPPVFFTRRKTIETALQRWSTSALARASERLQAAVLLTRRRPDLATATARQSLIALVVEAAHAGR